MKRRSIRTAKTRRSRRGSISLQVIFFLPLLILFTVAVLQFGMWLVAKQTIASSAGEGVQTAARGGDLRDITRTVARSLRTDKIPVSPKGDVAIVVERFGKDPEVSGNPNVRCRPNGPNLKPGEVRVTVCVRRGHAAGSRLPDWLSGLGRIFSPQRLQFSSLAVAE